MDRINKFLKSLSLSRRKEIRVLVERILKKDLINLDCKKLRGFSDIYKVRQGKIRIIFQKNIKEKNMIIVIKNRKEGTYKFSKKGP